LSVVGCRSSLVVRRRSRVFAGHATAQQRAFSSVNEGRGWFSVLLSITDDGETTQQSVGRCGSSRHRTVPTSPRRHDNRIPHRRCRFWSFDVVRYLWTFGFDFRTFGVWCLVALVKKQGSWRAVRGVVGSLFAWLVGWFVSLVGWRWVAFIDDAPVSAAASFGVNLESLMALRLARLHRSIVSGSLAKPHEAITNPNKHTRRCNTKQKTENRSKIHL